MNALEDRERERYLRQIVVPGWGEEAQQRLKAATVFVAGAGGLGSAAILYLVAAGVGCIRVCDRGRVELSNLNRQILHGERTIGMQKSSSAHRSSARLNRGVRVVSLAAEMTDGNVGELAAGADVLLDCLDNVQARMALNGFCIRARIPLVHAGVKGMGGQLSFLRPPSTPCLACFLGEESTPAPGPLPIVGAVAGTMGCLQALEALKYLTGIGELAENRILFFDGEAMAFDSVPITRSPGCPACSREPAEG